MLTDAPPKTRAKTANKEVRILGSREVLALCNLGALRWDVDFLNYPIFIYESEHSEKPNINN
jgi:hypothetical protein